MTTFKTPLDVDTDLLEAYDYALDDALIAQAPVTPRDAARLMIDAPGAPQHARFCDLVHHLRAGDLLVFNQTRVVPCRLYATKPTGGRVELFVLGVRLPDQPDEAGWGVPLGESGLLVCMTRASKPLRAGARLTLEGGREVEPDAGGRARGRACLLPARPRRGPRGGLHRQRRGAAR